MTGRDAIRFLGWIVALSALDALAMMTLGWHGDFDRNAAYAGFVTIISAIRDGQEERL